MRSTASAAGTTRLKSSPFREDGEAGRPSIHRIQPVRKPFEEARTKNSTMHSDQHQDDLSAADWPAIERILDAVIELPPTERHKAVAELCADNDRLRREVESLLTAHDEASGFLAADNGPVPSPNAVPERSRVGETIGGYELLEWLGHGGTGVVYKARRVRGPAEQVVAIKLLRWPDAPAATARRLEEEQRILARLEHPDIARLIDGGISPDGAPFLVTEYVDGTPLDGYCEQRPLTLEQRLDLFRCIARTVDFAHRNLIVHRDLKPGNILVDADGRPRVLDFGIAKLIAPREAGGEGLSETGMAMLTPSYAAPEQITNNPITTATDTYALGLLLFEMLTGRRAMELHDASLSTAVRRICEREPPAASSSVRPGCGRPAARRLRGDLDAICARALRKDPGERYPSAAALIADLGNYRKGLPVSARRGRWRYRAAKFIRRHRWGLAAGALVGASLLAGIAGTAWQARLARQHAAHAEREAAAAARIAEFLQGLFEVSDPAGAAGEDITARELLDRGAARIGTELAAEPATRARLQGVMGDVYTRLGAYAPALELTREALETARDTHGDHSRQAATHRLSLAELHRQRGEFDAAAALLEAVLETVSNAGAAESLPSVPDLRNRLGLVRTNQGRYAEAIPLLRQALAGFQRLPGDHEHAIASSTANLATAVQKNGDLEEAARLHQLALERIRAVRAGDHPDIATTLNNLATLHQELGDSATALELFQQTLGMLRRLMGDQHPYVAYTLHNIGGLHAADGREAEAMEHFSEALAIKRATIGEQHPSVANTLNSMGLVAAERGAWDAAEKHLQQAISQFEASVGANHWRTGAAHCNLAAVHAGRGHLRAAASRLQNAREIFADALPPDHWRHAAIAAVEGLIRLRDGQPSPAVERLEPAVVRLRESQPGGTDFRRAARALAEAYAAVGRDREAGALRAEIRDDPAPAADES